MPLARSSGGRVAGDAAELFVRVRRDGTDGTYLSFAGDTSLWPRPGKRIRSKRMIACMNRALDSGAVQSERWRSLDVRAVAVGADAVLFILRPCIAGPQPGEAQRMEAIGRLAGGVAHDFNNLLTVITGYGYMALDQPDRDPRPHLEEILRTAERAAALTSQLLEFSRPQSAEPRAIALNDVVLGMDKMLRRVIGEHIELVAATDPNAGTIHADPRQIEQVILNLVLNARDAVPYGGRIVVETTGEREHAVLSVVDNGVGMDERTRARAFEPFFTTKRRGKGTGLGLATVHQIVEESRGEIAVASAPDRGTAIRVWWPRVRPAALEPQAGPRVAGRQRGTETVLLVEDDDEVRRVIAAEIERCGYTVLEAARPRQAIAFCASHHGPIDLLLADAVMPHTSGRAVAERAGRARPGLRVLLMSGYSEHALAGRALVDPALPFLRKPFTPAALARKIREVLDGAEPPHAQTARAS